MDTFSYLLEKKSSGGCGGSSIDWTDLANDGWATGY